MFCPNCGKDCKDAKFCPECGTKLPQTVKTDAPWQPGMPCPHCGGTKLDGSNCLFCGAQLIVEVAQTSSEDPDSFEIPFGNFRAFGATLKIGRDAIVIEKDGLLVPRKNRIPYTQLTEVTFFYNDRNYGYLELSWSDGQKCHKVRVTAGVESDLEDCFYIYFVLWLLAPSARFVDQYTDGAEALVGEFSHISNLDEYFEKYSPYRNRAAAAIMREHGLPKRAARSLIDGLFNLRHTGMYEENPSLAVRDYNRIKIEIQREYDEYIRKKAQRRATRVD